MSQNFKIKSGPVETSYSLWNCKFDIFELCALKVTNCSKFLKEKILIKLS